ncbi:MAG: helix-turn-helix transcriptional regulator [Planctomycetota bacterium]
MHPPANNQPRAAIDGDYLRGHLETMILAVLEQDEAHGFEVLRRLEQAGCGALRLKEGTLYPALYRLEESGKVRARWEDNQTGRRGPRRRIYKITRKGTRQLSAGREAWTQFVDVVGGIVIGRALVPTPAEGTA